MTGPSTINLGVCAPWTDAQAITDCCPNEIDTSIDLDQIALEASDLLYQLSGRRYPGICEATVRPCQPQGCFGGAIGLLHINLWNGYYGPWRAHEDCCCARLSKITLAGYPVREILEVLIDGVAVDPLEYRLDRRRELVRLNGARWPGCQRLDVNDGPGTFFITYSYGVGPPSMGVRAAAQLACQLAQACGGDGDGTEDCELPAGTVRFTRQGITIDTQTLGLWLLGTQRTGMPLVDAFLGVYAAPRQRTTALAVPELDPYPLRVD